MSTVQRALLCGIRVKNDVQDFLKEAQCDTTEPDAACIISQSAIFKGRIAKCFWHRPSTFAVAFIPGKDAVLYAVAHQRSVDAHVAVAEERAADTGS